MVKKKLWRKCLLDASWLISLLQFQGTRPDQVKNLHSCFPTKLVSFVRPRQSVSFDPWHVTHSPPIGILIWARRNSLFNFSLPFSNSKKQRIFTPTYRINLTLCKDKKLSSYELITISKLHLFYRILYTCIYNCIRMVYLSNHLQEHNTCIRNTII